MATAQRIKGPYRWKDEEQRDERIREIVSLIMKRAIYRIDSVVARPNYDAYVRGKLPREIDDPYFLCFYNVILCTASFMNRANIEGTVDFVFDEQGPIGLKSNDWYWWVKSHVGEDIRKRMGSSPIFRSDSAVLPLKAADLFAWSIRRHLDMEQPEGHQPNDNLDLLLSLPGASNLITPDALAGLVSSGGLTLTSECHYFKPPA
jgi:hypothetical protein